MAGTGRPPAPRRRGVAARRGSRRRVPGGPRTSRAGRVRDQPRPAAERDDGHRRRVGLREVDHGQSHPSAASADRRFGPLRRRRAHRAERRPTAADPAPPAADLPGPHLLAQPEANRRRDRRRAAQDLGPRHGRRAEGTGRRGAGGGGPRARHFGREAAAPVLRRPVPAHLHRPRAGARPDTAHLRRARLGARRIGASPDPQPARRHEGPLRAHPRVHRPRPRGGEERERPGGGHVPGQALRGRAARVALRGARAPLHSGSPALDPRARPNRRAGTGRPGEHRAALPHRPAQRMPLPHPLPAGRRTVRAGGAADARHRSPRPLRRLPLPPHRRRGRRATAPASQESEPWRRGCPPATRRIKASNGAPAQERKRRPAWPGNANNTAARSGGPPRAAR